MKSNATKKQDSNEPSLRIPGKLPFEDYASEVKIADLVKMLVHNGALSVRDYELLVMRGHMFPLLESMTEANWMEVKEQLLEFLRPECPEDVDEEAEPET